MSASNIMTDDRRPQTADDQSRSAVGGRWSVRFIGWLLISVGAVADLIYNVPILLFGTRWPATIDTLGEFGHTVIFVGIVTVVFAVLQRHSSQSGNE